VSYRDHIDYPKAELQRRRQSQLVRRSVDVRRLLEEVRHREPIAMVDPGIGFHVRTLRMFMQRIAPQVER
jgi:hypothetical protein